MPPRAARGKRGSEGSRLQGRPHSTGGVRPRPLALELPPVPVLLTTPAAGWGARAPPPEEAGRSPASTRAGSPAGRRPPAPGGLGAPAGSRCSSGSPRRRRAAADAHEAPAPDAAAAGGPAAAAGAAPRRGSAPEAPARAAPCAAPAHALLPPTTAAGPAQRRRSAPCTSEVPAGAAQLGAPEASCGAPARAPSAPEVLAEAAVDAARGLERRSLSRSRQASVSKLSVGGRHGSVAQEPSRGGELVELRRLARAVEAPAAEMQRSYARFQEDLNLTLGDAEMRRIARENGMSLDEAERYKRLFAEVDVKCTGRIESGEFETLLCRCGKVPRGLASGMMRSFWLRADSGRTGSIGFEEFVVFTQKHFASGALRFGEGLRRSSY
ncbi:unnamed protein product [Prorocentrum cordatum]|uniref:EF-hand domain-containing protein n=1 Tax=Prorocentrum cordatum TaxID=2364126 RepID=A0ABN9V155_9DINO|nr:unnamed protein product [Polarella glacialis]